MMADIPGSTPRDDFSLPHDQRVQYGVPAGPRGHQALPPPPPPPPPSTSTPTTTASTTTTTTDTASIQVIPVGTSTVLDPVSGYSESLAKPATSEPPAPPPVVVTISASKALDPPVFTHQVVQLPERILLRIAQFMSPRSVVVCMMTCKKLHALFADQAIWRAQYVSLYGESAALRKGGLVTWKEVVLRCYKPYFDQWDMDTRKQLEALALRPVRDDIIVIRALCLRNASHREQPRLTNSSHARGNGASTGKQQVASEGNPVVVLDSLQVNEGGSGASDRDDDDDDGVAVGKGKGKDKGKGKGKGKGEGKGKGKGNGKGKGKKRKTGWLVYRARKRAAPKPVVVIQQDLGPFTATDYERVSKALVNLAVIIKRLCFRRHPFGPMTTRPGDKSQDNIVAGNTNTAVTSTTSTAAAVSASLGVGSVGLGGNSSSGVEVGVKPEAGSSKGPFVVPVSNTATTTTTTTTTTTGTTTATTSTTTTTTSPAATTGASAIDADGDTAMSNVDNAATTTATTSTTGGAALPAANPSTTTTTTTSDTSAQGVPMQVESAADTTTTTENSAALEAAEALRQAALDEERRVYQAKQEQDKRRFAPLAYSEDSLWERVACIVGVETTRLRDLAHDMMKLPALASVRESTEQLQADHTRAVQAAKRRSKPWRAPRASGGKRKREKKEKKERKRKRKNGPVDRRTFSSQRMAELEQLKAAALKEVGVSFTLKESTIATLIAMKGQSAGSCAIARYALDNHILITTGKTPENSLNRVLNQPQNAHLFKRLGPGQFVLADPKGHPEIEAKLAILQRSLRALRGEAEVEERDDDDDDGSNSSSSSSSGGNGGSSHSNDDDDEMSSASSGDDDDATAEPMSA